MKHVKIILLIIIALTNIGCSTKHVSIDTDELNHGHGIVILSTGAIETCGNGGTFLRLKIVTDDYIFGGPEREVFMVNNTFLTSDFEDEYGLSYAVLLEEGVYQFWIQPNSFIGFFDKGYIEQTIEVKENTIQYLGEFYNSEKCGIYLEDGYRFRDKWDRDKKYIKKFHPEIDISKVRKVIMGPINFVKMSVN